MSEARRTYTGEFKREAVELARRSGKTRAAIECELGLSKGLLKQWMGGAKSDGEQAFPGHGRLKADDEQVRRLERELAIVKEARDILKKAIAIFSQPPKRRTSS
jgi:transposase